MNALDDNYSPPDKTGKFTISLCAGKACCIKGIDRVLAQLIDELGVGFGETTADGLFSLRQEECMGKCADAPVLTVNDDTYEKVTPQQVSEILQKYAMLRYK